MRDRTINISERYTGSLKTVTYRRGVPYRVYNDAVWLDGAYVRKRVPSDDKTIRPEKEKPFEHRTLKVNPVRGTFNTVQDGLYRYMYEGLLSPTSFNAGGGTLYTNMAFPYGSHGGLPSAHTGLNPDLLSQAEVKALNKLRDNTGAADLDFGLWYAERHETVSLFRKGAVGLLNLSKAIARKDYRQSAEVLRDVFGVSASAKAERARMERFERWVQRESRRGRKIPNRVLKETEDAVLTYNLGVSPLLQDLAAAHTALQTGELPDGMRLKSVATHKRVTQDREERIVASGPEGSVKVVTTLAENHGYTVTLVARPLNTDIAKFQRWGLTDPLALLYQSTRLTFILDYFYALGPYLDSRTIPLGFEWIDGSWSQKVEKTVTFTVYSPYGGLAKGSYSLVAHQRKTYGFWPVPIPPLSLKSKDLTAKQALNAGLIALKSLRAMLGG